MRDQIVLVRISCIMILGYALSMLLEGLADDQSWGLVMGSIGIVLALFGLWGTRQ